MGSEGRNEKKITAKEKGTAWKKKNIQHSQAYADITQPSTQNW